MTLVNGYVTLEEIRSRLGGQVSVDQSAAIETAITDACRAIDRHCGQFFYDAVSATARVFTPMNESSCFVDPFSTTTGLIVKTDTGDDATFATTWAASDYELGYFGGARGQQFAAPFDTIRAVGSNMFPVSTRRIYTLQVTARWGWAAVPQNVAAAARILSVDMWKLKDVPFGVATGTVDFGGIRVGNNTMSRVVKLLERFCRYDMAGMA